MAVQTEKVAEEYLGVAANVPIAVDIPLLNKEDAVVLYGIVGLDDAVLDTDYTIVLGDEADDFEFVLTPLAPLITKINALIADDPDEINRLVVRRVMNYRTVTTPGAVSATRFVSREFDRTAMKLMQIAESQGRNIQLPPSYVNAQVPYLTPGDEGLMLMFGADGAIIPGPQVSLIGSVPALSAQVTIDAAQVAADRVAVHADMLAADADAASAADSALVALQTKGVFRGDWLTGTTYAKYDQTRQGTVIYSALLPHTSGVFATDLAAGKWTVYLQDGPPGPGSGDMLVSTYDPNTVAADAFNMANMVESAAGSGHLKMTTAERTKLTGVEAGAQVANLTRLHTTVSGGGSISPDSADFLAGIDTSGGVFGKFSLSNLITFFASALSGTFAAASHSHSFASITSKPNTRAGYGIVDAAPSTDVQGDYGSYAFCYDNTQTNVGFGGHRAGGNLQPCNSDDVPAAGGGLSGTWRCMGNCSNGPGDQSVTLWHRVA